MVEDDAYRGTGPTARYLGFLALLAATAAADALIWYGVSKAWHLGLHFHASETFTPAVMRDAVTLLGLLILVYLFPSPAALGRPDVRGAKNVLIAYASVASLTAALFLLNRTLTLFSAPFSNRGPFFFTLGPAAWELLWSGYVFSLTAALLRLEGRPLASAAAVVVLAMAGAAWYLPLLVVLRPLDAAGFAGISFIIGVLSLETRRRTGSIWAGLAGHMLVKFFLTG